MNLFKLLSAGTTTMKWLSIAALFGCGTSQNKDARRIVHGPFEVRWKIVRSSGPWFNNGGSPFNKETTSYFSVLHNGAVLRAYPKTSQCFQTMEAQQR